MPDAAELELRALLFEPAVVSTAADLIAAATGGEALLEHVNAVKDELLTLPPLESLTRMVALLSSLAALGAFAVGCMSTTDADGNEQRMEPLDALRSCETAIGLFRTGDLYDEQSDAA